MSTRRLSLGKTWIFTQYDHPGKCNAETGADKTLDGESEAAILIFVNQSTYTCCHYHRQKSGFQCLIPSWAFFASLQLLICLLVHIYCIWCRLNVIGSFLGVWDGVLILLIPNFSSHMGRIWHRHAVCSQYISLRPVRRLHLRIEWALRRELCLNRLQRAISRLRVEEKDNRNPEEIQACEEKVRAGLEMREHDRVDQDCPAYANSPTCNPKPISLCSHFWWEDFGGDQKGDSTPGSGVDQVEKEQHGDGRRGKLRCLWRCVDGSLVQRSCDQIDDEETSWASHQTTSTPESVNNLSTDNGTDCYLLARQQQKCKAIYLSRWCLDLQQDQLAWWNCSRLVSIELENMP